MNVVGGFGGRGKGFLGGEVRRLRLGAMRAETVCGGLRLVSCSGVGLGWGRGGGGGGNKGGVVHALRFGDVLGDLVVEGDGNGMEVEVISSEVMASGPFVGGVSTMMARGGGIWS